MPGTVYLVRHTAPAVASGSCYGAADVMLDAADFAAQLPAIHAQLPRAAALMASPLSRCGQLAQALIKLSPARTLRFDARLAEMNFGSWERTLWDALPRAQLDAWSADFWHYAGHGGESVQQLRQRVLGAWDAARDAAGAAAQPVALITHAGPMQLIQAHVHGYDLATQPRSKLKYGAILKFAL